MFALGIVRQSSLIVAVIFVGVFDFFFSFATTLETLPRYSGDLDG